MSDVQVVPRGCGATRACGGIYAECGLDQDGQPLEDFLYDPPVLVPDGMGLAPQGVKLIERDGVLHLIDWVGSNSYPNVADFVEEVRRFGLSRRLPSNIDFGRLDGRSRIMLVHARAWLDNPEAYRPPTHEPTYDCPQCWEQHKRGWASGMATSETVEAYKANPAGMCCGIWWEDVEGGWVSGADEDDIAPRTRIRKMPSFEYDAQVRPYTAEPAYRPAFFAAFPIHQLAVVADPVGGRHQTTMRKASLASLTVEVVGE